MVVVVVEHGGTTGLLTRIDVAEELYGGGAGSASVSSVAPQREADGSVMVVATAPVRDVNRALDLRFPESDDWATKLHQPAFKKAIARQHA